MRPFSIIVPTYKEVNNLTSLLQQIGSASFANETFEVLFVDDNSDDGSIELMRSLHADYPWAKMIIHDGQRGLGRSVMFGFQNASYPDLICMDADLSHPIDAIPAMLAALDHADMAVGSRYIAGGSVETNWPKRRKFISRTCALFTKYLLNLKVNDPLSGFFAIRQTTLQRGAINNPTGWKIGLEILIKCRCKQVAEIPIHFSDRRYGKSKLTARVGMAFMRQLSQLAYYQYKGL